jgi:transcriptional regulator with XRE-family HTH domain
MWERFEMLMKENKLRIADVSRATGISYSTFTDWKAGRYKPKADKMLTIASFFNVSYSYLMGLSEDRTTSKNVFDLTATTDLISQKYEEAVAEGDVPSDDNLSEKEIADKEKAIELYDLFRQASSEVQSAVELLLKAAQSES